MWRKLLRAVQALAYLGVLGVLFGLVAYVAFSVFVRGGVTPVPELRGLSEADALALLADQGLGTQWAEDGRFDEQVPKGHVLQQDPRPGVYVKRNTEVTLTLSRGPRRIEVPDLSGQALQAARVSLAGAGLVVGRTFDVYDAFGDSGVVVNQQPPPGSRVARDAPVDLFLSVGATAEVFVMPDLVRRSYDDVRAFFETRGFRIGRVSYETYDGVAAGTVLRQFPLAGHPLRRGEVISLGVVAPDELSDPAVDPATGAVGGAP
jgi:serine/threonine-protein kinase